MSATTKGCLTAFGATAVLALGLYGCGGGGGGGPTTGGETMIPGNGDDMTGDDMTGDDMTGDDMTDDDDMATVFDDGLVVSPGTSPEATEPGHTLENLRVAGEAFVPVVAPVRIETDSAGSYGIVTLDEVEAYVESVEFVGQSGFTVVYVVDGQTTEVEFGPEHLTDFGDYFVEEGDSRYWVWNAPTFSNLQPVPREYFALVGWQVDNLRGYASAGALTPPRNLATLGSARYEGQMVADLWDNFSEPEFFDNLGRMWGAVTLNANFSDGEIEGTIDEIWVEPPGTAYTNTAWYQLPDTTSISIDDGTIDGNRFDAAWAGHDTNSGSADTDSLRDYEGTMLGEFYGPNGEEVGGVITGQRERTSDVINGRFGAEKQQ